MDAPMQPWSVKTNASDALDVTLKPRFDKHSRSTFGFDLLPVPPSVRDVEGSIRGDDGVLRRIEGVLGFAEEARNRW